MSAPPPPDPFATTTTVNGVGGRHAAPIDPALLATMSADARRAVLTNTPHVYARVLAVNTRETDGERVVRVRVDDHHRQDFWLVIDIPLREVLAAAVITMAEQPSD